jgi:hypothetical protein
MLRLRIVASIVWAGVVAVQEITLSPFSDPVPKREAPPRIEGTIFPTFSNGDR